MTLGDYRQFQVAVTKNGQPVDLTSITLLTFTLQRPSGDLIAQWGLSSGVLVSSPASAGLAVLTVTPAMQAALTDMVYPLLYTWSLIDALGNPTLSLERGTFTLLPAPPGV